MKRGLRRAVTELGTLSQNGYGENSSSGKHGRSRVWSSDYTHFWKKPSGKIGGSLLHRKLFRDLKLETPAIDYDSIIALRDFAVDGDFLGEFKGLYSIGMGGSLHLLSRLLGKAKLGLNCKNDLTNAELYSEDPGNVIMIISPDSNPRLIEQLDKTHFYLGDVSDDQGLTFSNGKNFDWSLKGENPLGFLDL